MSSASSTVTPISAPTPAPTPSDASNLQPNDMIRPPISTDDVTKLIIPEGPGVDWFLAELRDMAGWQATSVVAGEIGSYVARRQLAGYTTPGEQMPTRFGLRPKADQDALIKAQLLETATSTATLLKQYPQGFHDTDTATTPTELDGRLPVSGYGLKTIASQCVINRNAVALAKGDGRDKDTTQRQRTGLFKAKNLADGHPAYKKALPALTFLSAMTLDLNDQIKPYLPDTLTNLLEQMKSISYDKPYTPYAVATDRWFTETLADGREIKFKSAMRSRPAEYPHPGVEETEYSKSLRKFYDTIATTTPTSRRRKSRRKRLSGKNASKSGSHKSNSSRNNAFSSDTTRFTGSRLENSRGSRATTKPSIVHHDHNSTPASLTERSNQSLDQTSTGREITDTVKEQRDQEMREGFERFRKDYISLAETSTNDGSETVRSADERAREMSELFAKFQRDCFSQAGMTCAPATGLAQTGSLVSCV